jgi:hypothetical protein
MKLELLDLAIADLIEGFQFYERQEVGLGTYFLDSLRFYGGIHRKAYKNLHRALSKRFPFAIYYTLEGEIVRVRSIVDCRKNPSWIRQHLRNA